MQEVQGTMVRIMSRDDNSGHLIANIETPQGKQVKVIGTLFGPQEGFDYEFSGVFENVPKWGRQFAFESYVLQKPTSSNALIEYLAENAPWVKEKRARLIYDAYGENALLVLKNSPDQVAKDIPGITEARAEELSKKLIALQDIERVMIELNDLLAIIKISKRAKSNIIRMWREKCVKVIKQNPYILIDAIPGIGFETADKLGLYLNGGNKFDARRTKAGILHTLWRESYGNGHICLPSHVYYTAIQKLLSHPGADNIHTNTQALVDSGDIVVTGDFIYLSKYYRQEQAIRNALVKKVQSPFIATKKLSTHDLADDQIAAVESISTNGVFVLTGAPGTGKTFTLKRILDSFPEAKVELAAPTGKAAKRMTEQTGYPAKTIHRLLEPEPSDEGWTFTRNAGNPVEADLIILDECSMIDVPLMSSFLSAVSAATRLIMVGDHYQLPPVGPGTVLMDMLDSGVIPSVELTEIKRQEEETGFIIKNCHRIKEGLNIEIPLAEDHTDFHFLEMQSEEAIKTTIIRLVSEELPAQFPDLDPLMDIQVLTPHRKDTVMLSCDGINIDLQKAMNDSPSCGKSYFRLGDKVIQTKNDYENEIINGDLGTIQSCDGKQMEVAFDNPARCVSLKLYDNDIQLAYALTVHKFQGSEAPIIVVPIHDSFSPKLMQRNLLYTAISRAQRLCILVGQSKELPVIINRQSQLNRYTHLAAYLREDLGGTQ